MTAKDFPILAFGDVAAWEAWLQAHGAISPGLWLKFSRAGAPGPTVGKAEAIEAALCHARPGPASLDGVPLCHSQRRVLIPSAGFCGALPSW
jgi:hypothetical protein